MKKLNYFYLILILCLSNLSAQEKLFTVEDVILNGFRLAPENLRQLNFIPNTNNFVWSAGMGEKSALLSSSPKNTGIDTLVKLTDLNSAIVKLNEKPLNSFPQINWKSSDEFYFWNNAAYYSYNTKFKNAAKVNSVNEKAVNRVVSPDKKLIAYTLDNNLFVSLGDNKTAQIT
ncbi:MAG: hypothetical protein WC061_04860, partial [Melioribacteraceae bacterium]